MPLTRCIIEQYGNYTVEVEGETLNVNGINSQVTMVMLMTALIVVSFVDD